MMMILIIFVIHIYTQQIIVRISRDTFLGTKENSALYCKLQ